MISIPDKRLCNSPVLSRSSVQRIILQPCKEMYIFITPEKEKAKKVLDGHYHLIPWISPFFFFFPFTFSSEEKGTAAAGKAAKIIVQKVGTKLELRFCEDGDKIARLCLLIPSCIGLYSSISPKLLQAMGCAADTVVLNLYLHQMGEI